MGQRTPLFQTHVDAGAKMVDFGGWDMPIHYGSQLDEHHVVRQDAGMFDVSHMCIVDLEGGGSRGFLRTLLANNVDKLQRAGKALYSCMLNEAGGVIDDLIVYHMHEDWFRIVVNAGTADSDVAWMERQLEGHADARLSVRSELAMIAVQGPNARDKTAMALGDFPRWDLFSAQRSVISLSPGPDTPVKMVLKSPCLRPNAWICGAHCPPPGCPLAGWAPGTR